jgi:hypothetical protein
MKGTDAQLIPIYGYDQRYPDVLYITEHDSSSGTTPLANNVRPFGNFYHFAHFQELCNLQAKLTGEKVVMDISSVKLVRLQRASGNRENQTLFNVRVQLWHEEDVRGRRGSQGDGASFVTAGTALSGPLRSKQVPKSSRLMIYLGRLEEWITVFVTDDVEVAADGQTMVRLKPRRDGWRRVSRFPGVAAHREEKKGSEPAGLDIHGQSLDPDIIHTYMLYDTFDIDFETSSSQVNFIRKWGDLLKERRSQRDTLERIEEDMRHTTLTGKAARKIW